MKLKFWEKDKPQKRGFNESIPTMWSWDTGGVNVSSPSLAMKIATVYRCVDILSGSIAALPFQFKVKRNGVFEVSNKGNLAYLLEIQPNDRLSAFDLMQNAVIQMVLHGNAYILPKYVFGELDSLILLSPNTTSYDQNMNKYTVNDFVNGVFETFDSDEIIHLRNLSLDGGYQGVSTITYASRVLSITANADERTLDSFKPGNTLKGFISGDGDAGIRGFGDIQDNQLDDITKRIESEINSGKNIFRIPGQAKFNQISIPSTDLQLLDTRKFGVLDICRFFGVHPDKVFAGQSQNYKASEMSNTSFLSDTLITRLRKIENAFSCKLIPRNLAFDQKIEFDIESLFQSDLTTMANYMEKTTQNGVYSANEWRRRMGQQPVDGGDQAMISCNVAPINSAKIKGDTQNLPPKTQPE